MVYLFRDSVDFGPIMPNTECSRFNFVGRFYFLDDCVVAVSVLLLGLLTPFSLDMKLLLYAVVNVAH